MIVAFTFFVLSLHINTKQMASFSLPTEKVDLFKKSEQINDAVLRSRIPAAPHADY